MTLADKQITELNQVAEGKSLDYKRELPCGADADRREFLRDISSFANAIGGHIIYGIDEQAGVPVALDGMATDGDAAARRCDSMIQSGIDPRIPGVSFRPISLASGAVAVVARVPQSAAAPHMVTYQGAQQFWTRNSAGKYQMSAAEIRAAFTSAAVLAAVRLELERTLASFLRKIRVPAQGSADDAHHQELINRFPEEERAAARAALTTLLATLEINVPYPRHRDFTVLAEEVVLDTAVETIRLTTQQATVALYYLIGGTVPPREIRLDALTQAMSLGSLLAYDFAKESLQDTDVTHAVSDLIEEVTDYQSRYEWLDRARDELTSYITRKHVSRTGYADIPMRVILPLWAAYDSQVNVYRRLSSLYLYVSDRRSSPSPYPPSLLPKTPYGPEVQRRIDRENATRADVDDMARFADFWDC